MDLYEIYEINQSCILTESKVALQRHEQLSLPGNRSRKRNRQVFQLNSNSLSRQIFRAESAAMSLFRNKIENEYGT